MDAASEPTNLDFKVALTFIFTSRKWPRKLAVAIACVSLFWFPLVALTLLLLAQSMAMGHSAAHLASRTGIVLLVLGLLSSVPGVLLFGYAIETARVVRSGAAELPFWRPLRSKLVDGALLGLVLVIWALPSTLLSFAAPASLHRPLPSLPGYSHSTIGSGMFHTFSALSFIWMVILAPLYPAIWSQYLGRGFLASFHLPQLTHRVVSHLRVTLTLIGLQIVPALIVSLGLAAAGIGIVLALPYAALVQGHLYGQYARLTDASMSQPSPLPDRIRRLLTRLGKWTPKGMLFVTIVCLVGFGGDRSRSSLNSPTADPVIEFENLPATGVGEIATTLVNSQYSSNDIFFNNATLLDYSKGSSIPSFAHSGTKAIEQCYGEEFCTTPIDMTFGQPVSRVKVWVGYSAPLAQDRTVELLAFDASGNLAAFAVATFRASTSPQLIQTPLEARSNIANLVRARVTFNLVNIPTAHLAVDDIEFDLPGFPICSSTVTPISGPAPLPVQFRGTASGGAPPYAFNWDFGDVGTPFGAASASHTYTRPGRYTAILTARDSAGKVCSRATTIEVTSGNDRTAPIVHILAPLAGASLTTPELGTFHLSGEVVEDGVLSALEVRARRLDTGSVSSAPLTFREPAAGNSNYMFDTAEACCLALGTNLVTVRATDGARNVGEASVTVVRADVALDITIAGYEVTQAIAYAIPAFQSCLDMSTGPAFQGRPCTDNLSTQLPMMRGKDTVVRIYPKTLYAPTAVSAVHARLYVRHGETLVKTLDPMNTLGSTAAINIQPNVALTDLRKSLTGSWNFPLTADDTNTDELNLDVVVNPLDSGHIPECMTLPCSNNNHLRLVVPFHQPKTLTIRVVRIYVRERDGSLTQVRQDEVDNLERYIRQVYPMRVVFDEGVFVTYDRSDIHPLFGLTGLFLQSERGGSVTALDRAILNFLLLRDLSAVVACAECYAFPEPDYYILGLSPIRDSFGAGLGWPPLHFYFEVPVISWFTDATRIDVLSFGCNVGWAKISDNDGPGRGSQENSHNLEIGPGHFSTNHGEQDLGWLSPLVDYTAKAIAIVSGNWWLLALNVDFPMRAEPDDQDGNIREFGLDMTGNLTPGRWRVVNPCNGCVGPGNPGPSGWGSVPHTHDFMSYGADTWISPLTYYRLSRANP